MPNQIHNSTKSSPLTLSTNAHQIFDTHQIYIIYMRCTRSLDSAEYCITNFLKFDTSRNQDGRLMIIQNIETLEKKVAIFILLPSPHALLLLVFVTWFFFDLFNTKAEKRERSAEREKGQRKSPPKRTAQRKGVQIEKVKRGMGKKQQVTSMTIRKLKKWKQPVQWNFNNTQMK